MPAVPHTFKKVVHSSKKSKFFFVCFLFLLIVIPVFLSTKRPSPTEQANTQIQTIVASLSKKVDLPSGIPNVYTVKDVTKLNGQEFFKNAKNGDKVLIYVSAKKAFLYRPSEDKLIEVAYYNPPEPTKAVAGASTSEAPSPTSIETPTRTPSPTKTILTPTASPSGNF